MATFPPGTRVSLTKWNVVWHSKRKDNAPVPAGDYSFDIALFMGSLDQVRAALASPSSSSRVSS